MTRRALVVGAGGAVGESIALNLLGLGWQVTASLHTQRPDVAERLARAGAAVAIHDIDHSATWAELGAGCDAWVFATHLERTVRALAAVSPINARVVAFSSNNVAVHPEAPSYQGLAAAERQLRTRMPDALIIRPTMIYGDRRLPTLSRLLRLARWAPVLPLPGSGNAKLQPVFCGDLGRLAAGLADRDTPPGVYAAGGPEIVSMRALFEAAVAAAGGRAVIAPLPQFLLRASAALPLSGFSPAQAARSERDRVVVAEAPLPADLAPRVGLEEGLRAHVESMRAGARARRSPAHA